jgi:hypothetical protein
MSDIYGEMLGQFDALIERGDLTTALVRISNLARFLSGATLPGRPISAPELDRLCQRIGAAASGTAPPSAAASGGREENCYIVTEIAPVGGHSRLLDDLIRLQPERQHRVLVTNLFDTELALPDFITEAADCRVAPRGNALDKLRWLQRELRTPVPARVFLLNHWNDPAAVAAVQPGNVPCLFVHHVDHLFCLGVHVPHFVHVDLFPLRFHACRDELGIGNNIYWPCTVADRGVRDAATLGTGPTLTTCTSGNSNKFRAPYPFSYFDSVPVILEATGGRHVHIGPLPEEDRNALAAGLRRHGLGGDRLTHIPWVRSLWDALGEQQVDLYISSFPAAGGRAMIEALGSGTPILGHRHLHEAMLADFHALYPGALLWQRPHEMVETLRAVTPEMLREHARRGRQWYEVNYRPELLATALRDPGSATAVPPRPPQAYIDPVAGHVWTERLRTLLREQTDLVKLLDSAGLADQSVEVLRDIAQLAEPAAVAYFEAGRRYVSRGNTDAARRMLARAAEINPADGRARELLDRIATPGGTTR